MDSIKLPDSLMFKTLVNDRKVYGGGGILPDIFVGIDTSETSEYYGNMIRKGVMNNYVLRYLDDNRKSLLATYPTVVDFKNKFQVTQEMIDDLVKAGEADEVKLNKEQLQKSERLIKINMRGLIARSLYEAGDFYYMTNELNDTYMRAVKVLQENQMKDFKVQHY
jgi:carboxyl-terminal processing protease